MEIDEDDENDDENDDDNDNDNDDDDDESSASFNDANSDAGVADTFSGNCIDTCLPKWLVVQEKSQRRKRQLREATLQIQHLRREIQRRNRTINARNTTIENLQARIDALLGLNRRTEIVSSSASSVTVANSCPRHGLEFYGNG